ncbi:hypothetical protein FisN_4Lh226 [Fistulifera solaris]|uniref:Uncharacterized protein n=1 Tax=Fistulifera solaris TaxID=1519565 RepID=A0A1Z5JZ38_FISSO|nr:hypothetical protein FisN_4Lh226 [Fistulifera solaris]|eukprot:GAX19189.1 hypothetical protein FisN_4Lh226 [Fistulifera solaris]
MFTRIFIFFFASSSTFWKKVAGVCYCPIQCFNCLDNGDIIRWPIYKSAPCNDLESAQECEKANAEIKDMQNSIVPLVLLFLDDAVRTQNMTMMQAGYARSLVSLALEDDKPEGDCANGLLTDTPIKGTLGKCFSPELLEQCARVRDRVNSYQDNIPIKLESFLGNNTMMYSDNMTLYDRSLELNLINSDRVVIHPKMAELIEMVRFRGKIRTARIRCASFDATTIEIAEAGALSTTTAFSLTVLSAASVMWF